ncbi:hypothetical protein EBQ81_01615 [bacterium]|nr:hypothetical protein [bacterium]
MEDIQRNLGKHDAQIEVLEKEVHLLRQDMAQIFEKLDSINQTLATAKGGWQTLMMIGGAAGTAFAAIQWLINVVTNGR